MQVEGCQGLHQSEVVGRGEVPLRNLDLGKQLPGQCGDVVDGRQGVGSLGWVHTQVQQAGEKPGREIHLG